MKVNGRALDASSAPVSCLTLNRAWNAGDRLIASELADQTRRPSIGIPDDAPGSNTQGLTMYCGGGETGAWLAHSDQYRDLQHCYTAPVAYSKPSPEYFQYVEYPGPGLAPVGYGYRSIAGIIDAAIDDAALIATPANSSYNERVIEAARESLRQRGAQIPC